MAGGGSLLGSITSFEHPVFARDPIWIVCEENIQRQNRIIRMSKLFQSTFYVTVNEAKTAERPAGRDGTGARRRSVRGLLPRANTRLLGRDPSQGTWTGCQMRLVPRRKCRSGLLSPRSEPNCRLASVRRAPTGTGA